MRKIPGWIVSAMAGATLFVSPSVRGQAQAAGPAEAGPTMAQTIDFINSTFQKMGAFSYSGDQDHGKVYIKWVGYTGYKMHKTKIESQSAALADADTLVYTLKAVDAVENKDGYPVDKKGNVKGPNKEGIYMAASGGDLKWETTNTESRIDATNRIDLAHADAGKITIEANTASVWHMAMVEGESDTYQDEPVTPQTWSVWIAAPSEAQKGSLVKLRLGVFYDKDVAERMARAYSHAIALRHRAEAPSLF